MTGLGAMWSESSSFGDAIARIHHSRIVYAIYKTKKAHSENNLAGNATTYSSSDSSSPLGKLTSSSSSAFLLREDMVILGSKRYQLGEKALSKGGKGIGKSSVSAAQERK